MKDLTILQLRNLLRVLVELGGENEWIEFKENINAPDTFGKTLSAVSNSARLHKQPFGFVVSGVDDKTMGIVGTTFKPSAESIKNQPWEMYMTQMLNPHPMCDIFEFTTEDGKPIVIIRIPRSSTPPLKYNNIAYIRIGSCVSSLNQYPDHERALWQDDKDAEFGEVLVMQNLTAADVARYLHYERFSELSNNDGITVSDITSYLLTEDHIIKKQSDGKYAITKLGALLFARDMKAFPNLKSKMVRVTKYSDNSNLVSLSEKDGGMGYAAGFPKLIAFVMDLIPNKPEVITGALRERTKQYPEIAIREILANALIHQDFMQLGRPTVNIFSDRVEISNPGIPIVNTDQFLTECISRNEKVATLMKRVRICEDRGSGMDRVALALENEQLPAYDIIKSDFKTTVILYAAKPFDEMTKEERIRACYLHCIRKYARREKMTNSTLRERFQIDVRNSPIATRIINYTLEAGLIKAEDPDNQSAKLMAYVPHWAKKINSLE